jgi:hypothetical protein
MFPRLGRGPLAAQFRAVSLAATDECLELLEDGQTDLPRSLHDCRKRLKWLRALLRYVRSSQSRKAFRVQDARLRDAARHLSPGRAESALRGALHTAAEHFGVEAPEEAAQSCGLGGDHFLRALEDRTAPGRRAAHHLLLQSRRDVAEWLEGLDDESAAKVLTHGLLREWKRARRAFRRAQADPSPEVVHQWRKHVKYHLHQLQAAQQKGCGFRRRIKELRELAELLGDAHDLSELRHRLTGAWSPEPGAPDWNALLRAREAELTLAALERGAPAFSYPPTELLRAVREALSERS